MSHLRDLLDNRIAAEEEVLTTHSDDGRLVAVTDRRLLRLGHSRGKGGRDIVETKSVILTGSPVRGSAVTTRGETDPDMIGAGLGSIIALVGAVAGVVGFDQSELVQLLAVLVGLGLLIIGAALVHSSLQTEEGDVVVEVRPTGGDDTILLPEGAEEVGTDVSRIISEHA